VPLERGFSDSLGWFSLFRGLLTNGIQVYQVFGPWDALTVELRQRRRSANAWRLWLLLRLTTEGEHIDVPRTRFLEGGTEKEKETLVK